MILDKYVSENELEGVRRKYGQKIIKFPLIQDEITMYYKRFGLQYPNSCVNNFRDSWFHYRKIWEEHSYYAIISQTSTLDEHLQRAERDAVVNLLQILSQKMEFWYLANNKKRIDFVKKELGDEIVLMAEAIDFVDYRSLIQYWKSFSGDEMKATFALIYVVGVHLPQQKECYRELQDILHMMKNNTLEIRLGASEINRLNEPGEYLECCRGVLEKILYSKYFNLYLYLVQMYDVVSAYLDHFFQNKEDEADSDGSEGSELCNRESNLSKPFGRSINSV